MGGSQMRYTIYTDGGCSGNRRDAGCPGGFGFIIIDDTGAVIREGGGRVEDTTNNRMEMTAVIEGATALIELINSLQQSSSTYSVTVCTDSQYVAYNFEEYLPEWKKRGWRKGNGQPVLNKDLWKKLDGLIPEFQSFSFRWVRGHALDRLNERADAIVRKHIYG
jgi:ribonuclease HI